MRRVLFSETCDDAIQCLRMLVPMVDERFFDGQMNEKVDTTQLLALLEEDATRLDNAFLRCFALLWMLRLPEFTTLEEEGEDGELIFRMRLILESMARCGYNHLGDSAHTRVLVKLRQACSS